jgi:hypothetical protein
VYCWRVDQVVIVQDQRDRTLTRPDRELVDHCRGHRLERRVRAAEQRVDQLEDARSHLIKCRGKISPEPGRVIVAIVQRQPCRRLPAASGPRAKQRCLSEAGGALGQPRQQLRTREGAWRRVWNLVATSASRSGMAPIGGLIVGGSALTSHTSATGRARRERLKRSHCKARHAEPTTRPRHAPPGLPARFHQRIHFRVTPRDPSRPSVIVNDCEGL